MKKALTLIVMVAMPALALAQTQIPNMTVPAVQGLQSSFCSSSCGIRSLDCGPCDRETDHSRAARQSLWQGLSEDLQSQQNHANMRFSTCQSNAPP